MGVGLERASKETARLVCHRTHTHTRTHIYTHGGCAHKSKSQETGTDRTSSERTPNENGRCPAPAAHPALDVRSEGRGRTGRAAALFCRRSAQRIKLNLATHTAEGAGSAREQCRLHKGRRLRSSAAASAPAQRYYHCADGWTKREAAEQRQQREREEERERGRGITTERKGQSSTKPTATHCCDGRSAGEAERGGGAAQDARRRRSQRQHSALREESRERGREKEERAERGRRGRTTKKPIAPLLTSLPPLIRRLPLPRDQSRSAAAAASTGCSCCAPSRGQGGGQGGAGGCVTLSHKMRKHCALTT